MKEIGLFPLFFILLKTGTFTLGGGYAMLPIIEREFVGVRKWLTEEEILDVFALAQTVPGAVAVNTSILIGYRLKKIPGALLSLAGMVLPSFVIISLLSFFYRSFSDIPLVSKAFGGIRAGVTALIFLTALRMGRKTWTDVFSFLIGLSALVAVVVWNIPVYWVIPASAFLGFGYTFIKDRRPI